MISAIVCIVGELGKAGQGWPADLQCWLEPSCGTFKTFLAQSSQCVLFSCSFFRSQWPWLGCIKQKAESPVQGTSHVSKADMIMNSVPGSKKNSI